MTTAYHFQYISDDVEASFAQHCCVTLCKLGRRWASSLASMSSFARSVLNPRERSLVTCHIRRWMVNAFFALEESPSNKVASQFCMSVSPPNEYYYSLILVQ